MSVHDVLTFANGSVGDADAIIVARTRWLAASHGALTRPRIAPAGL